jgi:hypothetical protein
MIAGATLYRRWTPFKVAWRKSSPSTSRKGEIDTQRQRKRRKRKKKEKEKDPDYTPIHYYTSNLTVKIFVGGSSCRRRPPAQWFRASATKDTGDKPKFRSQKAKCP